MTARLRPEICILGGGPAGAAAALKLARLGHDVLVLEKEAFPRPHVGESLAPGIWRQLELLELADAVRAAGFPSARAAVVRWGGPAETRPGPAGEPGLLVDRGRFDRLLLEAARSAGARVLQPARALRPHRTARGWIVPVLDAGKEIEVSARYLVDATGRASRLGGRKILTTEPALALYASWARRRGAWRETRVEAGKGVWFWGAPLPDGTFNAMAFLNAEQYRSRRRAGSDRASLYRELLGRSALLSDLLAGEFPARVWACDATCRYDPEPIGEDFVKLGEAAYTIDPLSSSGVQVALRTAWSGAIAVHTILTRPGNLEAAIQFHTNDQEYSVRRHAAWASAYHAQTENRGEASRSSAVESSGFWESERCVQLSEAAAILETPCIRGDLIETRRGLSHPSLERAVVYLDGIEIAPLLDMIPKPISLSRLASLWSASLPPRQAFAIACWMIRHGVFTSAAGTPSNEG